MNILQVRHVRLHMQVHEILSFVIMCYVWIWFEASLQFQDCFTCNLLLKSIKGEKKQNLKQPWPRSFERDSTQLRRHKLRSREVSAESVLKPTMAPAAAVSSRTNGEICSSWTWQPRLGIFSNQAGLRVLESCSLGQCVHFDDKSFWSCCPMKHAAIFFYWTKSPPL